MGAGRWASTQPLLRSLWAWRGFAGEGARGRGRGCPCCWRCRQGSGLATALIPLLLGTALLLAGDITREPTPCLLSVSPSRSFIHRQRWQDQGCVRARAGGSSMRAASEAQGARTT